MPNFFKFSQGFDRLILFMTCKCTINEFTKTGNKRCRKLLVEAVQHYSKAPRISTKMQKDLAQVDGCSAAIAVKCLKRLHHRYWSLTMKGKIRPVVITAIAREIVGFIWATMQPITVEA